MVTITVLASNAGAVTGGTSPICLGSSTGTMTLSGYTGTIVKWQKRVNAGAWTDIANTAATYSETPASAGTWEYVGVVQNATLMTSLQTIIDVSPLSVGGTVTGGSTICYGNTSGVLTLSGYAGTIVKCRVLLMGHNLDRYRQYGNYLYSGALTQTTQFRAVVQSSPLFGFQFSCSNSFS